MKIPMLSRIIPGLVAVGYVIITQAAAAQVTPPDDHDRTLIRAMMERIDQLEKRVNELETEKGPRLNPLPAPSPTTAAMIESPAPAATGTQRPAAPHDHDAVPLSDATSTYPALHLSGFSDINFAATDRKGDRSGFSEGQFILHMTSALSQRVNFFGEISFTARADGGQGSPAAPGFNVEVERSIIRFDQSDKLKVSFGRYHTPINYWNTAFHHGSWLQTTISRPEMAQFGGSLLPVHFLGALAEGTFPAAGLNLHYSTGLGNGRGTVISRGGDFGDNNNNRALIMSLFAKPDFAYGLQVGASFYRDKITPVTSPAAREWIQTAHVVWQKENPEFIAEFANVTHTLVGSQREFRSQAWYMQAAYRLPVGERLFKPYYRFEYIHVPRSDVIFALVQNLAGSTVGLRYDISSFAALKLEYRNQKRVGLPRINGIYAQTSFTF
ncbi:MAG: hypothetical protein JWN34_3120 [Bryobacterales bacterium]|jgi:hypothetical protein|nr:hypothetical protein [Bryobacterales bacterium]